VINFLNDSKELPFVKLKNYFNSAKESNQSFIDAMAVSSYSTSSGEVDSRFVNLKIVDDQDLIFFSNYSSEKAAQFITHTQISILIFWSAINIQIRMKGHIKKTSKNFNDNYFKNRSEKKNALAISSAQSKVIDSYDAVRKNYENAYRNADLKKCPDYWGGYKFKPYYFEFWEGHESRINKREIFYYSDDIWKNSFLQP